MGDNKTIAKNTVYLYIRMLVTMFIALYTSRVVLQKLGVDDYGIYQSVGGIVGLLSFVNAAIATGTSRFLTFELGKGDRERLKRTFSSALTVHLIIALFVIFLAETVGLWFVRNKLVLSADRYSAAITTYHASIITVVLALIQVPFSASIIAHEKMDTYAIISVFEAVAKLAICYLISYSNIDKLVTYALLLLFVQISVYLSYSLYCSYKYYECKYRLSFEKAILKPLLSFSGWSLFANGAIALTNQGVLVLLNMFFSPAIVAGRAISLQVIGAANQLVSNYRLAVNPQIIKLYAVNEKEESKSLLLQSTKFSYYLMLVIAVPVFYLIDPILKIWLGENIPIYTSIFIKIGVLQSLVQVFDTSFYTALYAKGRLKENALLSPTVLFLVFPIVYILFRCGCSPIVLSWAYLLAFAILGLIVKPLLLVRIVEYNWRDIIQVFLPCCFVSLAIAFFSFLVDSALSPNSIGGYLVEIVLFEIIVCGVSYTIGIDKDMKKKIIGFILSKLKYRKK